MFEMIVTVLIVLAAGAWLTRRLFFTAKGDRGCGCGCSGCDKAQGPGGCPGGGA